MLRQVGYKYCYRVGFRVLTIQGYTIILFTHLNDFLN